jgi:predicted MFS family arabinose efflux permease
VVRYADADRVSLAVGFYYSANAAGRLVGTILSGAVFQLAGGGMDGLVACLVTAAVMVTAATVLCGPLRRAEDRLASP